MHFTTGVLEYRYDIRRLFALTNLTVLALLRRRLRLRRFTTVRSTSRLTVTSNRNSILSTSSPRPSIYRRCSQILSAPSCFVSIDPLSTARGPFSASSHAYRNNKLRNSSRLTPLNLSVHVRLIEKLLSSVARCMVRFDCYVSGQFTMRLHVQMYICSVPRSVSHILPNE
jgi:hypothetical protein